MTQEILHQRWVHSHEDDTANEMVFRPADYPFPPSRGRRFFELKADGSLVEGGPGAADRPKESQGRWKLEEGKKLLFYAGSRKEPSRVMEVKSVGNDRLVVEKKK